MMNEGRILAVDYGEKRIGLALSDPMRMFAKPLSVLLNSGLQHTITELESLISLHSVSLVLVGMPFAIDGSDTPKTQETKAFAEELAGALSVPVLGFDERYSTCDADDELKRMGYTWQEAKKVKDAMAACMFLKEFLDS
ncbi:MAG: Holliday junction resolvase RuvX [Candidatus Cloacimonetes bacterium HGW-Cloacimonetes-3]|jgi:putative Holliday junction resolvase|nr:MAG: Holliday junction resolvase RuvX [Candidatus Cloacimonetes bacterium HGW-Cloacimonetes-3]